MTRFKRASSLVGVSGMTRMRQQYKACTLEGRSVHGPNPLQGSEIDPRQDSLSCPAEEEMGLSFKVKEDSMSIEHKLTPVAFTSAKNVTASEGIFSDSSGHVTRAC